MKRNSLSNKKRIFSTLFLFFACLAGISIAFSSKLQAASSLSLSIGLPHDGALKNGEVLPASGAGYQLLSTAKARRARFGVTELIRLIKQSTFEVHRKWKGAKAAVGDLSRRTGGKFEHHASHQNGRDVDVAFYILSMDGTSVAAGTLMPFDKNGYSIDPPMTYRFDTVRNWALVEQLLTSRTAEVQWIFVAGHLETLLLEYAQSKGVSKRIISRAEQVLKQPSNSSHFDHFHVRIYCPVNDKPECTDAGPKWAWYR